MSPKVRASQLQNQRRNQSVPMMEDDRERVLWNRQLSARRPAIGDDGFDMPGFSGHYYMWPEEYALLAKYVGLTRGDYLEIGSMCGIIAMSLAEKYSDRNFVCVDAFVPGHATIAGEKQTFLRNLREHNLKNVTLIEGDSLKVVPTLTQSFDVIFIDGNHAYEYVLGDALNSWRLLSPGGFLIFHDYECVEETTRAVHDFLNQSGACLVEGASCLVVASKPAEPLQQASARKELFNISGHVALESYERKGLLITSPGEALWNQREAIAAMRNRLEALSEAVGLPTDLTITQWVQITAFALDFRPDLIIELGRERGRSTCCFLEVANQLGGPGACKLISLCLSDNWFKHTLPRLKSLVPREWFAPGDIRMVNLLDFDFRSTLEQYRRPLIFWDAHGFDIAECVLGSILPNLVNKEHRVLMHDLSDTRYSDPQREYGDVGLWKGENGTDPSFRLGHVFSRVAQAISILDFSNRNDLRLHSADESLHQVFASYAGKLTELKSLLGEEMVSLQGHWFWFSLNESCGNLTFPRFTRPADRPRLNWWRRLRDHLAPHGSRHRRLYNSAVRSVRRLT